MSTGVRGARGGLALPGVLSAHDLARTGAYIASQQLPSGLIPWFDGHHADPWDHIESAMALALTGHRDLARKALLWSAHHQRADGTWPMEIVLRDGREHVADATADANQCAYLAVGVWHDWLLFGDRGVVRQLWPAVRAALDVVCDLQQSSGGISWARSPQGTVDPQTLLTSSACIVLSLRCGIALAELVGDPQPEWELALQRLAHAVAVHPDGFADRSRFSMDWYYPILGGAVQGRDAVALLTSRWSEFVVPGRGIRCVADRPWVTAAETCELVLTLDVLGDRVRGAQLLRDVQFCRDADGGYLTGWVWPEDVFWPEEKSTWTAGAVVLAVDALARHTPASGLFRGDGLPPVVVAGCDEHCPAAAGVTRD
jgi:hypothetical protein